MTVARFGVEREKNKVASFKILAANEVGQLGVRFKKTKSHMMYLQNVSQLDSNLPL